MNYHFCSNIKENDTLRRSFNELTAKIFGFDFTDWYDAGQWREEYKPHCLLDGDRVIANVSVNFMLFELDGVQKNYIQIGTVMTDPEYRGKGLSRMLMEKVLSTYQPDGFYLFANDSVLDFYPKFGFTPIMEYRCRRDCKVAVPYEMQKLDPNDPQIPAMIEQSFENPDETTSFRMNGNLSLYQFWLADGYHEMLYFLPETDSLIVAECDGKTLMLHQVFGKKAVDPDRLAAAFGAKELILGFTPLDASGYECLQYQEEGTTLFILGDDLNCITERKLIFPTLTHT